MNAYRRFISLNAKVVLLTIIIAAIPIAIIGTIFYVDMLNITNQRQNISIINSLKGISQNVEDVMDDARNLSLLLIQDDKVRSLLQHEGSDSGVVTQKKLDIIRMLTFYLGRNNNIGSIQLTNKNISLNYGSSGTHVFNTDEDTLQTLDRLKGGQLWRFEQIAVGPGNELRDFVSLVRNVNNIQNPKQKLGVLRINIDGAAFRALYQNNLDAYGGDIYMIDEYNKIISSNNSAMLNQICPHELRIAGLNDNFTRVKLDGTDNQVYSVGLSKVPWRLVEVIPYKDIRFGSGMIIDILAAGVIVSLILCFFVSFLLSRSILNPLRRLASQMQNLKENNYKVNLVLKSNDEIGLLYTSFNEMSHKLDELINEVFVEKLYQKEAELKALQAQINPHFLYNSLDTAYWLSRLEHAPKTGEVIIALSRIYKLSMSAGTGLIGVDREIEHIKSYIAIQRVRYKESIRFNIEMPADVGRILTIPFILQPLVENAIVHGLFPAGRGGVINLRVGIEEGELLFIVEDDGIGGDIEEITALLDDIQSTGSKGFALRNIQQRIQLSYGKHYGFTFSGNNGGGLIVTVHQPVVESESGKTEPNLG